MILRLIALHFRMNRLALIGWALGLILFGGLSVYLVADPQPSHLPQPHMGIATLFLVVYAVMYASGRLSCGAGDALLPTLGALPVRRIRLFIADSGFFVLASAGLCILSWGATALAVEVVEADAYYVNLAVSSAIAYLTVLAVFSVSLVAAALCSRRVSALALSAVVLLLAYLAETVASGYGPVEWLAWFSVFHWYDPIAILRDGTVDWLGVGILGGVVAGGHALALAVFSRRELPL